MTIGDRRSARLRTLSLHPGTARNYFSSSGKRVMLRARKVEANRAVGTTTEEILAMQLAPYLFFDGTCEEALAFYAQVLGGKVSQINRFADSPVSENMPPEHRERIMHATFEAPGMTLMASDGGESEEMARASLSLATADREEGARVFAALAAGGTITMPYAKQFWGASFGSLVDRFGIRWMVNAG